MFLHLKKDLDADRKNWIGHNELPDPAEPEKDEKDTYTSYGIDKKIQHQLAATRTDLDSFSDTEAFALMCSGYAMADQELKQSEDLKRLFTAERTQWNWRFLTIMPAMKPNDGYRPWYDKITRTLNASCQLAGKPWRLAPLWCSTVTLLLLVAVAGSAWLLGSQWNLEYLSTAIRFVGAWIKADRIALWAVGLLVVIIVAALKSGSARRKLFAIIMIPGSVIGMLHRYLYDKHFLRIGSLKSFKPMTAPAPGAKAR